MVGIFGIFGIPNSVPNIPGEMCPQRTHTMIALYLRAKQERIGICAEFVKFDENRFEEIHKKMEEEISRRELSPAECEQVTEEFLNLGQKRIAGKFESLFFPLNIANMCFERFVAMYTKHPSQTDGLAKERLASFYMSCKLSIETLKTIIDENLEMFSPRSKNSKEPITLRVFEDGDQQFLIKSKVTDTLEAKSTLRKKWGDEDDEYTLDTITLEEVLKNFDTKNIEFIRYPILRAKHRATPILIPNPDEPDAAYVLAIDEFFEFLKDLILGLKFYQKVVVDWMDYENSIFFILEALFKLDCTTPYFKSCPKRGAVRDIVSDVFKNIENIPAKDIRNAKSDGFTVQNLKNELAHLGLITNFPEIQEHAEAVYSEVDKRKKERFLRTCDLFDAVEQCQLICILVRHPQLKKFVHSQKGCNRVYGLKCEDCAAQNPEKQKDQKLAILEKELEALKLAHQKILEDNQQKSLEIQELQQKNLRLSVKNETNEVKLKQLTEKLAQTKLSIDDGNYSTACTSQQKIQCLICEKSIETGEDQIIRCPLCKGRFHSKCAINWLKEHKECPACNGDLPKF
ncbi:hypothetical protein B9Z55_004348 [Caenorhabditis nigoni]|uniref:RING-type domain-containing protein n=1 Tax=Caenorhabditis nigoni TaxID=1611254 RepID=A0A2G5UVZ2_9PELO|nr:hypothetical protein B9Z55_004348 [Caenorhabditis nigoni]